MTSGVIKWAASSDWVVPAGEDYLATFDGLAGTPLNGFQESHSASSFDVDIDTGEAFVGGRWMARDDAPTTVTLDSGQTNQTVYAGWESSTANSVKIGLDSAFSSTDDGRRTPIWEFDTDGSGVTNSDRVHDTEPIHPHADDADSLAGVSSSNYARTDISETFSSSISVGGNIALNNNDITNVASVQSGDTDARLNLNVGGSDIALQTGGSGSGAARVHDNSTGEPLVRFLEGGGTEFHAPFGHLKLFEADTNEQWNVAVSSQNLNLANQSGGSGLLRLFPGGNVAAPNGVLESSRGTAAVSGFERYIFVSSGSPSDSDGQDGDIWIEH